MSADRVNRSGLMPNGERVHDLAQQERPLRRGERADLEWAGQTIDSLHLSVRMLGDILAELWTENLGDYARGLWVDSFLDGDAEALLLAEVLAELGVDPEDLDSGEDAS